MLDLNPQPSHHGANALPPGLVFLPVVDGMSVKVGSCLTHISAAVSFFSPKHLTRLASVHEANLDSVFEENTDSF